MKERIGVSKVERINGYLNRVTPVYDSDGELLNYNITPIMVEFRPRDLMQVIIGASVLAVPVAFTEEAWNLGATLPLPNIIFMSITSFVFIGFYVYLNFYKYMFKNHVFSYFKRVLSIYFISLLIVAFLLTLINQCPWQEDLILSIKRVLVVSFPASMSATISDTMK